MWRLHNKVDFFVLTSAITAVKEKEKQAICCKLFSKSDLRPSVRRKVIMEVTALYFFFHT